MGSTNRRRSSVQRSQRSRSRTVVIAAAAMLAMQSTLLPAVASAQAPDAKQSLASGDKAARAKDWAKAEAD